MNRNTSLAAIVIGLAFAALPSFAQAQSYRCTGADGKRYYGQIIPRPCIGQVVEQLNEQGLVVRRIEPRSTADEREAKAAEEKKRRDEELARREELRRNRALLATYTSVQDIEDARIRALEGNSQAIKDVDQRITQIKVRQEKLASEMGAYKDKPAPEELKRDIKNTEIDLEAQQGLRQAKQREAETINARYDEDRKRYLELTQPAKESKQ
ncbi:MAG: hypothetical protein AMJ64_07005 [Betaproteobacteria bacterium SG8_39]|nr:MAG: hypothetical protein AMJ64_07005 [Betaproteobacteria bacterium SG8_39]